MAIWLDETKRFVPICLQHLSFARTTPGHIATFTWSGAYINGLIDH